MREILFRGKTPDGRWAYGSLILGTGDYCCILESEDVVHPLDYPYLDGFIGTIDGEATPVIPETVGQFTGLLDKNDKKIFEGDMVQCEVEHDSHPHRGSIMTQVKFIGGYFTPLHASNILSVEIIGNIHDNPEFLEVKT